VAEAMAAGLAETVADWEEAAASQEDTAGKGTAVASEACWP
tara:strand:+ start:1075 stop:1197 length:123 start_codon:yes stop_codon:yes gene_type:complete